METSAFVQISAFEERLARAQATDVIELPWGFALLQRDYPSSYDHNRVVVTSAASCADILAAADRALGDAGMTHRQICIVDGSLGQDLRSDFAIAGYECERMSTMVFQGETPPAPLHDVQSVSIEAMRPALMRDWNMSLPTATPEQHAELADRIYLYDVGADVSRLVVYEDSAIAARLDVYVDRTNGIAQLQNLFTHPDFRGRGYAKSLICDGQRRAEEAECPLSFLGADLDDWPQQWYGRLGFVDTYHSYTFTK